MFLCILTPFFHKKIDLFLSKYCLIVSLIMYRNNNYFSFIKMIEIGNHLRVSGL